MRDSSDFHFIQNVYFQLTFTTGQTTDHPPQGSTVEEEVERL